VVIVAIGAAIKKFWNKITGANKGDKVA